MVLSSQNLHKKEGVSKRLPGVGGEQGGDDSLEKYTVPAYLLVDSKLHFLYPKETMHGQRIEASTS